MLPAKISDKLFGFLIRTIKSDSQPWQQSSFPGPLGKYLALKTYSGRRFWQAVEAFFLPVHFQQLHVCMSPLNEGYILLEIVTRACYDTHEVEKVAYVFQKGGFCSAKIK